MQNNLGTENDRLVALKEVRKAVEAKRMDAQVVYQVPHVPMASMPGCNMVYNDEPGMAGAEIVRADGSRICFGGVESINAYALENSISDDDVECLVNLDSLAKLSGLSVPVPAIGAVDVTEVQDAYIISPEKDSVVVTRLKDGATLFMQGDDASKFLGEVDAIEDVGLRNYAISQYDDVFDLPEPQQEAGEPVQLSDDKLRGVLAAEGEGMDAENVGFYPSVEALVEKVRSSKNWEQGSIFVFAESENKFVVMKQIAPASCEMLTITQHGYKDVNTAYAFGHDELVALVKDYMAGDLSLEEQSLKEAFEVGMQKGSCSVVDTTLDRTHSGKVLGVTDHHVVLSLGRSALVVGKADIDRVPAVGEDVDLKFAGGKGVFAPVKAVGVER